MVRFRRQDFFQSSVRRVAVTRGVVERGEADGRRRHDARVCG
jgi:hypothetical protein